MRWIDVALRMVLMVVALAMVAPVEGRMPKGGKKGSQEAWERSYQPRRRPVEAEVKALTEANKRALPAELQQGRPRVNVTADTFDQALERQTARFSGAFQVGVVFVEFPDCEPLNEEARLAELSAGAEAYFKRYTQGICWPEFAVMGRYRAPHALGFYTAHKGVYNLLGSRDVNETMRRVEELWKQAMGVGRSGRGAREVDVWMLAYATKPLAEWKLKTVEEVAAAYRPAEENLAWTLESYRPKEGIRWGDPLWPNSRVIVQADGGAATVIHELGHVLGAPDTYHAGEKDNGVPGTPVTIPGGPTAPLYCRYRYCGLLGADAYRLMREDGRITLAPRWSAFNGTMPLGIFLPTEHPEYLLHLEYEPAAPETFASSGREGEVGQARDPGKQPQGGIYVYYIHVTQGDSYHGPVDLVYAYRAKDPYFRGETGSRFSRSWYSHDARNFAVFRRGDRFDATSDPANVLPNLQLTGVEIEFGEQTLEGAEVIFKLPKRRLSGQALRQANLPVVRMEKPTELQPTSFRARLTMCFRGDPVYTDFGFCYGPRPKPTVKDRVWPLWGFTDWEDCSRITGFRPGSTVYVRAYAKSALGLVYSPEEHQVVLPKGVEEVPPLLLDGYADAGGYIWNSGYALPRSGAVALLALMNHFRRPLDGTKPSAKDGFSYQRLHPKPGVSPWNPTRYEPTVKDMNQALESAKVLAEACGLFGKTFPEDFEQRIEEKLDVKGVKAQRPPQRGLAVNRRLGGGRGQAKRAPSVVLVQETTIKGLLPRVRASLMEGIPVLFAYREPPKYSEYGVGVDLIDGYRTHDGTKDQVPLAEPQVHLHLREGSARWGRKETAWVGMEELLGNIKEGYLIFLN